MAVGLFRQHTFMQRFEDAIAPVLPNMPVVLSPTQLKNQLVLRTHSVL